MKYMVIAKVRNDWYMTKVAATSACAAEHKILDLGFCGIHDYGVDGATAYDENAMRSDSFVENAIIADPVSFDELVDIIDANNARIKAKDNAERRIQQIENQMKVLAEELESAKRILRA